MARRGPNNAEENTRDRILSAAWSLYRRNATSNFTLAELADRIGLHYTVLYHYFRNKSDLEAEIVESYSARRSQRLAQVCAESGSGLDHLVNFIHAEMLEPPSNLLVRQYDVFAEPYRSRVNKALDDNVRELAQIVRQGIEDGSIRACTPRLVAGLVMRILNRYANQNEVLLSQAGLDASALAGQIVTFVCDGIVADDLDEQDIPGDLFHPFPRLHTSSSNLGLLMVTLIRSLNERGYDATSLPEVAAGIGLSKTSFYRFAASKEELLYLAAHRSLSLQQQLRQMARAVGRDSLDTLLHLVFYARYLVDNEPGPLLHPAIFRSLSDEHARVAWDIFNAGRFDTIDLLNEGMRHGQFRRMDAIAVQPMLTSIMNSPLRSSSGLVDEVTRLMLRGVATRNRVSAEDLRQGSPP